MKKLIFFKKFLFLFNSIYFFFFFNINIIFYIFFLTFKNKKKIYLNKNKIFIYRIFLKFKFFNNFLFNNFIYIFIFFLTFCIFLNIKTYRVYFNYYILIHILFIFILLFFFKNFYKNFYFNLFILNNWKIKKFFLKSNNNFFIFKMINVYFKKIKIFYNSRGFFKSFKYYLLLKKYGVIKIFTNNDIFLKNLHFKNLMNESQIRFSLLIYYMNDFKNLRKVIIKNYLNYKNLRMCFMNKNIILKSEYIFNNNFINSINFMNYSILEKSFFIFKKIFLKNFLLFNLGPSIKFNIYKNIKKYHVFINYLYPININWKSFNINNVLINKKNIFFKIPFFNYENFLKFNFYYNEKFLKIFLLNIFLRNNFVFFSKNNLLNLLIYFKNKKIFFKKSFFIFFKNYESFLNLNFKIYFIKVLNLKKIQNITILVGEEYKYFFIFLFIIFLIMALFSNFVFKNIYDK